MKELSQEEKQNLEELLHHEGMKAFFKILQSATQSFTDRVLQYRVDDNTSNLSLIIQKSRAEGAQDLARALMVQLSKKPSNTRKT